MVDLLGDIVNWMEGLSPLWVYVTILLIAYGENVLPPIPGDMIVVFGGYLAGRGQVDLFVVVLLATIGGAIGFMTMYAIGHRLGYALLRSRRWRWLPHDQIAKAQRWLRSWGYGIVAANRFLSGARSVIALSVGMAHMRAWPTAAFATLSALMWTALISFAGYKVGENWEQISVYLRNYGQGVLIVLGVLLLVQGVRFYRRRKKRHESTHASDEAAHE